MTELSTPPSYSRVLSSWQPMPSKYDMWKDVIEKLQNNGTIQTLPRTNQATTMDKQSSDVVTLGSSIKDLQPREEVKLEQKSSDSRIEVSV